MPYAFAAKFAHPDRPAIALVGDGAMQMHGKAELITSPSTGSEWSDQRLIVIVLNNHDLNQVTWEQRVLEGDPKLEASQDVPDFDYARYAELIGLRGSGWTTPEDVGARVGRGAVAPTGPSWSMRSSIPGAAPAAAHPHRTGEGTSPRRIFKGDRDSWDIIKQSIKGKAAEFATR